KPMHSWRVLLLPFIDEQELYDQYHFDEPWNGPNNIKLLAHMPRIYACPSAEHDYGGRSTITSYVAVVGPETAWPGTSRRTRATLNDGIAGTALVVECDQEKIPWLEPRDLEYNQALKMLSGDPITSGGHRSEDFFYE